MYVYVFTCMCVCLYVCVCVYMYASVHVYLSVYPCTHLLYVHVALAHSRTHAHMCKVCKVWMRRRKRHERLLCCPDKRDRSLQWTQGQWTQGQWTQGQCRLRGTVPPQAPTKKNWPLSGQLEDHFTLKLPLPRCHHRCRHQPHQQPRQRSQQR